VPDCGVAIADEKHAGLKPGATGKRFLVPHGETLAAKDRKAEGLRYKGGSHKWRASRTTTANVVALRASRRATFFRHKLLIGGMPHEAGICL
jgi:hypothetical protein